MVEDDDEDALFREGVELFNAGEWFEAHEVWEDAWRLAEGPRKRFYQGLIQCAVTLEHARRGNPRGVRSVIKTARPKFEGLPRVYHGVDVPKLIAELTACVQPILDLPAEAFDPGRSRGQTLPFDPAKAPKIELSR
jgi:predicted metal-dependent hydrolase